MTNETEGTATGSDFDSARTKRKEAEALIREQLAASDLDGPHKIYGGDTFSMLSGAFGGSGAELVYAICLKCGAMVKLEDPEELTDGRQIERSVRLHTGWHRGQS